MKTLKVLSIIGIVWFILSWICMAGLSNNGDYYSAGGWGYSAILYGVAFVIVVLVKSCRK